MPFCRNLQDHCHLQYMANGLGFFSLDVIRHLPGHAVQTAMHLEINILCQWKAVSRSKAAAMQSSRRVDMHICNSSSATELLTLRSCCRGTWLQCSFKLFCITISYAAAMSLMLYGWTLFPFQFILLTASSWNMWAQCSMWHVLCHDRQWLPGSKSEMKQKQILILTYSSGNLSKLKIHVKERHMTYLSAQYTLMNVLKCNYTQHQHWC